MSYKYLPAATSLSLRFTNKFVPVWINFQVRVIISSKKHYLLHIFTKKSRFVFLIFGKRNTKTSIATLLELYAVTKFQLLLIIVAIATVLQNMCAFLLPIFWNALSWWHSLIFHITKNTFCWFFSCFRLVVILQTILLN